jgi:hypothetical protein
MNREFMESYLKTECHMSQEDVKAWNEQNSAKI